MAELDFFFLFYVYRLPPNQAAMFTYVTDKLN